jgi:hypothetical protein
MDPKYDEIARRYPHLIKAMQHEWIKDAIESGWWDDAHALTQYFQDVLFDLKSELDCLYPHPWRDELKQAAQGISSRLAQLGAPYEVYHPNL